MWRGAAAAGLVLLLVQLWGRSCCERAEPLVYLSSWAVHVPAGTQEARRLARRHGLQYVGQVLEGQPYYHLRHRGTSKALRQHMGWHRRLRREPQVTWFEQQTLKKRQKREISAVPTDPWFRKQWYLNDDVLPDLNVLGVWSQGYTGAGVVVSVLDDGIERDHPDLVANFDPKASYDFNDNDPDPQPRYTIEEENRHGTRCAGEVAATANNDFCGAGIAYQAKVGGVRMLDGIVTDIVEARSLSLQPQHIHIYSASWGPEDDGKTVDGPGFLAMEAFRRGVTTGRGGLGSLFIWASGNGGLRHDNCNLDGYANSIYTLSVGSSTQSGRVPWYTEACASILTTTYSSGSKGEQQIVTTDLHHSCTSRHTGTSASAPLAAGMIALALEANPKLTWRDMQHLVVRASHPAHLQADDWVVNGVGRKVSHYYGYGLLNAAVLVDLAKKWDTARPQRKCYVKAIHRPLCLGSKLAVTENVTSACCETGRSIRALEHVQIQLSLRYSRRGDLVVTLTSPMGTTSTLVDIRPFDTSDQGYRDWTFMSTHYWDEDPRGVWTLLFENKGDPFNSGFLDSLVFKLYGTEEDMMARNISAPVVGECMRRDADGTCQECTSPFYAFQSRCLYYCPPRYYSASRPAPGRRGAIRTCAACDSSCYTCRGGTARNCTSCPAFSTFDKRAHACSQQPFYAFLPHLFAQGHWQLLILALLALLCVCPILCGLFYALYRWVALRVALWTQARMRTDTEAAGLELLEQRQLGAGDGLRDPLQRPLTAPRSKKSAS